jgi:hypothetical protein
MKTSRSRRAFTIVELLISITLLAVVGGAIAVAVATQWRSHDWQADGDRARQAVRDAADVLLAELRSVSPAGGDLVLASDTAFEVRATIGAAVICSVSVARDRVTLPSRRPTAGAALTGWRDAPVPGDSVVLLDGRAGLPDTISRHELIAIGGGVCPASSGFARSAADAASGTQVTLAPPLAPSIGAGAPLRFQRRARYSIYRSSADGRWYFGIKELLGGSWSSVQPVAGPLAPAAAGGAGGMNVVVRNRAGAMVSAPPLGAATELEITLRANGSRPARALGRSAAVAESLRIVLSPRND